VALDIRILLGFAWPNIIYPYVMLPGPLNEFMTDEFRTVIASDSYRFFALLHQLLQRPDEPESG
jgi:hypothetical protein